MTYKEKQEQAQKQDSAVLEKKPSPNDSLDLSKFDYRKMTGDMFRDYLKLIASLKHADQYDFEAYKVAPIKQPRYEGVQGSPNDIIGFRIVDVQPVMNTRIPVKIALDFNGKLDEGKSWFTVIGGQWGNHGGTPGLYPRYYLLKKGSPL
jgi:hypothetical protein